MIKLDHVTKTRQSTIVLSSVDMTFYDNTHYVILCENKSDKTTLFNIIKGYETADDGTIEAYSQGSIEYLLDECLLFPNATVKESMQIKWLAKNKDLNEFEEQYTKAIKLLDLEEFADKKVSDLSQVQKKCLELANVFIMKPKCVLMLDTLEDLPENDKKLIINLIENNFKDTTVIISSCISNDKYFDSFTILTLLNGEVALHE